MKKKFASYAALLLFAVLTVGALTVTIRVYETANTEADILATAATLFLGVCTVMIARTIREERRTGHNDDAPRRVNPRS